MKNFKRVIAILLVLTLLVSTFSACSSFNLKSMDNILTKGEWAQKICSYFGIEDINDNSAFFKDVTVNDEAYSSVQAIASWGIVDTTKNFNPNEKITKEYAVATAVKAIGSNITGIDDSSSDVKLAKYAVKTGIAESDSWIYMHKGVTQSDADKILENAVKVYTQRDFEDYDKSQYKDTLKRESDIDTYRVDTVENEVVVDTDKNEYSVGDTVVFGEGIDQIGLKIVDISINGNKTILKTEKAELSDIVDSLDVSGTGTVEKASDIKTVDGVQITSFNGQSLVGAYQSPDVEPLGNSNDTEFTDVKKHDLEKSKKKSDIGFKVELSKGKVSASITNGSFENSAEYGKVKRDKNGDPIKDEKGKEIPADQLSKWESKDEKQSDTYSGGYKITGSINIDELEVGLKLKYNTVDAFGYDTKVLNMFDPADAFDFSINAKITNTLSFGGYIKEDLKIGTIPIAVGPCTFNIDVKLYATLSGSLAVKLVCHNATSISWESGRGLKRATHTDTEKDFEINIDIETGIKFEINIGVFEIDIIDVDFSAGIECEIKFQMNDLVLADEGLYLHGGDEQYLTNAESVYLLCFDATITFPIVKIGINTGDSLFAKIDKKLKKVKLSAEWEIVGSEDATHKGAELPLHYELNNGFVDSCLKDSLQQYKKENEENEETTLPENESQESNSKSYLSIDKYSLDIDSGKTGIITITSIPEGCTIDDIQVESKDTKVATVKVEKTDEKEAIITVSGVDEGVTSIIISCSKTNDRYSCTVIVGD